MSGGDDRFWGGVWWVPDSDGRLRTATPGECCAEIERLRSGIQAVLDGNYPEPETSALGGGCPHGRPYYEDCLECTDAWLAELLNA